MDANAPWAAGAGGFMPAVPAPAELEMPVQVLEFPAPWAALRRALPSASPRPAWGPRALAVARAGVLTPLWLVAAGAGVWGVGAMGVLGPALPGFPAEASACGPEYTVRRVAAPAANGRATVEYRLYADGHHFLSYVDEEGTANLRAHPGVDANGWGTSWYAQPFLPGAELGHTVPPVLRPECGGVRAVFTGAVSRGRGDTYGAWQMRMVLRYEPVAGRVLGEGEYEIDLRGPLTEGTGDLNLYRLASNYLRQVPLLDGSTGDTGDMREVRVSAGGAAYRWSPKGEPALFPPETSDRLAVRLVGERNRVATAELGAAPIAEASKPGVSVTLEALSRAGEMTFGAIYATALARDFAADNVGVGALLLQDGGERGALRYRVRLEAVPGPGDRGPRASSMR